MENSDLTHPFNRANELQWAELEARILIQREYLNPVYLMKYFQDLSEVTKDEAYRLTVLITQTLDQNEIQIENLRQSNVRYKKFLPHLFDVDSNIIIDNKYGLTK